MVLFKDIDYILSSKIRPFYYAKLSRFFIPRFFDDFFCFCYSSNFDGELKTIERYEKRFLFDTKEKETYLGILKNHYSKALETTLSNADLIVEHKFDLLGSGLVNLGPTIDWHQDFKSGFIWENRFYKDINKIRLKDNSDIKVPWELSRFHHFSTLGKAYWISGNEKYAQEFVDQLLDWIRHNPPRIGVNWCNSMEIAIRLANWICAYIFFKSSPCFTHEIKKVFFRSVLIQQIYIYHNLEFGYRRPHGGGQLNGNHYVADLIGIITPCIVFPELFSNKLYRKTLNWLYREIQFQVNPDGVHYELSIGYHRLMLEFFLSVALLMTRNGEKFPQFMSAKIQKMLEFVVAYTRPDGLAPQVRDADNGRLFSFSNLDINDHRYLLNIGAVLFDRSDFKAVFPSFSEEAFWWLGPSGFNTFCKLPNTVKNLGSRAFLESGFYFMRKQDNYLMALCAGGGMGGYGGHGHNDALSFELFTRGRSVIIDPGTYVYSADPKVRNLFRSTSYHNAVCMDGIEINNFDPNKLFSLPDEAHPQVENWINEDKQDILVCSHSGYAKIPGKIVHKRIILFNKIENYWEITDHLLGSGSHHIKIFFHFAPGLIPDNECNEYTILLRDRIGFQFALIMSENSGWDIKFTRGWISPSYGIKKRAWIGSFHKVAKLPVKANFIMKPL